MPWMERVNVGSRCRIIIIECVIVVCTALIYTPSTPSRRTKKDSRSQFAKLSTPAPASHHLIYPHTAVKVTHINTHAQQHVHTANDVDLHVYHVVFEFIIVYIHSCICSLRFPFLLQLLAQHLHHLQQSFDVVLDLRNLLVPLGKSI